MIGMDHGDDEPILLYSITGDDFDDTLCIENPDGTGDVFFVSRGEVGDARA